MPGRRATDVGDSDQPPPLPAQVAIPRIQCKGEPAAEISRERRYLSQVLLGLTVVSGLGIAGLKISQRVNYLRPIEIEGLIGDILNFRNQTEKVSPGISESMWQGLKIEELEGLEEKEREDLFKSLLDVKGIEVSDSSILITDREVVIQIRLKNVPVSYAWDLKRDETGLTAIGYNITEQLPDMGREYVKTNIGSRTIQRLVLVEAHNPSAKRIERFETDANGTLIGASNENRSASPEYLQQVNLSELLKR